MKRFGDRLRVLRAIHQCTQIELSKETGVSRYRLSLLECGYDQPSSEEQVKIKKGIKSFKSTGERP